MGIPQIIMIILMVLTLVRGFVNDGKSEWRKTDFVGVSLGVAVNAIILYFGGFWNN